MFIGLCLSTILLVAQPTEGIVYENPEILTQDISQNEIIDSDKEIEKNEIISATTLSDNSLSEDTEMVGQDLLLPEGFTDSVLTYLDIIAKLLIAIFVLNILIVGYGFANITLKHFRS